MSLKRGACQSFWKLITEYQSERATGKVISSFVTGPSHSPVASAGISPAARARTTARAASVRIVKKSTPHVPGVEVALGIDSRHAPHSGGRYCLAVPEVDNISSREDSGHGGLGRLARKDDVAPR